MLPLPGCVRRAIFAEYEPEVEYLDAIAWRKSPCTLHVRYDGTAATSQCALRPLPYLVAKLRSGKTKSARLAQRLRRLAEALISPPALATFSNQHSQL